MTAGVPLADMAALCRAEADRLDVVQDAMVEAGVNRARNAEAERRIRVFLALARLVDTVRGDKLILERLRQIRGAHPAPAGEAGGA
jgi:hypothetical protein